MQKREEGTVLLAGNRSGVSLPDNNLVRDYLKEIGEKSTGQPLDNYPVGVYNPHRTMYTPVGYLRKC